MNVHIDLGYTQKLMEFRMFVDKKDQGRALVLNNLLKDSNGELSMTVEFHRPRRRHLQRAHRSAAVARNPDARGLAHARGAMSAKEPSEHST